MKQPDTGEKEYIAVVYVCSNSRRIISTTLEEIVAS